MLFRALIVLITGALTAQATTAMAQALMSRQFLLEDGTPVPFDPLYRVHVSGRRTPNHLRAAGWEFGLLGVGTVQYWTERDLNEFDWDFPPIVDRLNFRAVRFDDNRFTTNTLGHPLAGLGYYGLARVNGLPVWQAMLYAAVTSTAWEFGLEWREKVSINDLILTPFSGFAVGEFVYRLGEYLNSAPYGGELGNRIAGATLGFPQFIHDRMDDAEAPSSLPADELGFSSAYWHRFRLAYQVSGLKNDVHGRATMHGVRAEAELLAMPGFMRPGRFDLWFDDGVLTSFAFQMGTAQGHLAEVDMRFDASLVGYYRQHVDVSEGRAQGYAGMVAYSAGFRHLDRWLLGRRDQLAVTHLAGPSFNLWLKRGDLMGRIKAGLHLDFVAVRSLAFPRWANEHGVFGIKTVLDKRGYYHGFGFSTGIGAEVAYHGLSLGADVGFALYRSIEGLDRKQEIVTRDPAHEDQMLEYDLTIAYGPPAGLVHLSVGVQGTLRWSHMGDATQNRRDRRLFASAGLRF